MHSSWTHWRTRSRTALASAGISKSMAILALPFRSSCLSCRSAAALAVVDLDRGSGDGVGGGRAEVEQRAVQLRRIAQALARHVLADVAHALQHAVHHLRGKGPRRDGVDVDVELGPLDRQRL